MGKRSSQPHPIKAILLALAIAAISIALIGFAGSPLSVQAAIGGAGIVLSCALLFISLIALRLYYIAGSSFTTSQVGGAELESGIFEHDREAEQIAQDLNVGTG